MRPYTMIGLLVGIMLAAAPVLGADDLAEVLPADALAVVRVTGLHAQWQSFRNSEAFAALEAGPIPEIGNGIRRARDEIAGFEAAAAVNLEQCLSAIFGADVALALFPDQAVVFVARTADLENLRLAIDTIRGIERDEGRLIGETSHSYQGAEIISAQIIKRDLPGAPPSNRHHAIIGDLLVVSEQLDVVRRTLDVVKGEQPSLATSPEYRAAAGFMRPTALVRAYFDTDRILAGRDLEALFNGGMQNPVIRMLARRMHQILPATRFAAGDLTVDDEGVRLRYTILYDEEQLPPSLRALFPAKAAPLDITNLVPQSAVIAFANRVNKRALWHYVLESLAEANPQLADEAALQFAQVGMMCGGMDFERDLLPQLGDQAAVIVMPGSEKSPPAMSIAIELNDLQSIPIALKTIAGTAATTARMQAQKTGVEPQIALSRTNYATTDLTTLVLKDKKFAGRLEPTVFVSSRFMVLSSSLHAAHAILDALKQSPPDDAGSQTRGTIVSKGYLNVTGLCGMIARHRELLILHAQKDGKTAEKATHDIAALLFLAGFLERVDLQMSHARGRIERTLHIRFRRDRVIAAEGK